jgi:hypothetical protein
MGGGKKYNIWIAYSDLFTNLSTFLFISAIGVFAAWGSGVFDDVAAISPETARGGCSVDAAAEANVEKTLGQADAEGKASLLAKLASFPEQGRQGECTDYYTVPGVIQNVVQRNPSVDENTDLSGKRLTEEDWRSRFCDQIWLTNVHKDFDAARGRVTIMSVGAAPGSSNAQKQCFGNRPREDAIRDFPQGRRGVPRPPPSEAIAQCEAEIPKGRNPYPRTPEFCQRVLACLNPQSRVRDDEWCITVREARTRAQLYDKACGKMSAIMRARTLYQFCIGAPDSTKFPTHFLTGDNVIDSAHALDTFREQWRNVGYDAIVLEAKQLEGQRTLGARGIREGSVVVKVQYER